jgi:transcriptional regulator with XRE-family HTH domain
MRKLAEVGARLVWTREALDYGQAEIATLLDISPQRLNNYEAGLRPLDVDVAERFVERWKKAKGLDLDWLYLGDDSSLSKGFAEAIDERRREHEARQRRRLAS